MKHARTPFGLVARTSVLALSAGILFAGSAFAMHHGKGHRGHHAAPPSFEEVDADKDGFITKEELKQHRDKRRSERFKKVDKDGDGGLSEEELKQAKEEREEQRRKRMIERFDENGDGKLQEDELEKAQEMRREHMKQRREKRRERMKERRQGGGEGRRDPFSRIDTDGDGKISKAEWDAHHQKRKQR